MTPTIFWGLQNSVFAFKILNRKNKHCAKKCNLHSQSSCIIYVLQFVEYIILWIFWYDAYFKLLFLYNFIWAKTNLIIYWELINPLPTAGNSSQLRFWLTGVILESNYTVYCCRHLKAPFASFSYKTYEAKFALITGITVSRQRDLMIKLLRTTELQRFPNFFTHIELLGSKTFLAHLFDKLKHLPETNVYTYFTIT